MEAYIPQQVFFSERVQYWVTHAAGTSLRIIDQSLQTGQWAELGTFDFSGVGNEHVSLSDITGESNARLIVFDAIRRVPYESVPGSQAAVLLTPFSGPLGARVTATGRGFPPGQLIDVQILVPDGQPFPAAPTGLVASDGSFAITFRLPSLLPGSVPGQSLELIVNCTTQDGTSASARFLVDAR